MTSIDSDGVPPALLPVCLEFFNHGQCHYGVKCKFVHSRDVKDMTAVVQTGQSDSVPMCSICGVVGHRTQLCVQQFIPTNVIQTTPRRKARLTQYLLASDLYAHLAIKIIPTDKVDAIIFITCNDRSALLHRMQTDAAINRHFLALYTVQHNVRSLDALIADVRQTLTTTAADMNKTVNELPIRIQTFPRNINTIIRTEIQENNNKYILSEMIKCDSRQFTHILFIVFAYNRYHYAIETRDHYYVHIDQRTDSRIVSGGDTGVDLSVASGRNAQPETVVCRAYYKLHELCLTDRAIANSFSTCRNALDIGAAPGGWTSYVASLGIRVLAVDPGELSIPSSPLITHCRQRIQNCAAQLDSHGPFDLILCDMNIYSHLACGLILSLIKYTTTNARLVFTIKELETYRARILTTTATELLSCAFEDINIRFLLSNGRERTLTATRKHVVDESEVKCVIEQLQANQPSHIKTDFDRRHCRQDENEQVSDEANCDDISHNEVEPAAPYKLIVGGVHGATKLVITDCGVSRVETDLIMNGDAFGMTFDESQIDVT